MQNINYWKQFESTGKIEDYLSYRSSFSASEEQLPNPVKENAHAGIHMCNRNDIETNAYRGI